MDVANAKKQLADIILNKASWSVAKDAQGEVGQCSVGAWSYGTSRSIDCGFTCVPYTRS